MHTCYFSLVERFIVLVFILFSDQKRVLFSCVFKDIVSVLLQVFKKFQFLFSYYVVLLSSVFANFLVTDNNITSVWMIIDVYVCITYLYTLHCIITAVTAGSCEEGATAAVWLPPPSSVSFSSFPLSSFPFFTLHFSFHYSILSIRSPLFLSSRHEAVRPYPVGGSVYSQWGSRAPAARAFLKKIFRVQKTCLGKYCVNHTVVKGRYSFRGREGAMCHPAS